MIPAAGLNFVTPVIKDRVLLRCLVARPFSRYDMEELGTAKVFDVVERAHQHVKIMTINGSRYS